VKRGRFRGTLIEGCWLRGIILQSLPPELLFTSSSMEFRVLIRFCEHSCCLLTSAETIDLSQLEQKQGGMAVMEDQQGTALSSAK
jgi:hypothetical protein